MVPVEWASLSCMLAGAQGARRQTLLITLLVGLLDIHLRKKAATPGRVLLLCVWFAASLPLCLPCLASRPPAPPAGPAPGRAQGRPPTQLENWGGVSPFLTLPHSTLSPRGRPAWPGAPAQPHQPHQPHQLCTSSAHCPQSPDTPP